jgi:exopolysaccharide production negative regulator
MPISDRLALKGFGVALALLAGAGSGVAQDIAIAPAVELSLQEVEAVTLENPDAGALPAPRLTDPLDTISRSLAFDSGVTNSQLLAALEGAADAGQPLALWQLGVMYEDGVGVAADAVKAFSYFSRIANDNADAPPTSREAGIIAQSFLKIGEYYRSGLPGAGISIDSRHARALILYAASYFGDPEAQFRAGELYLEDKTIRSNVIQAGRWLGLAARKGHAGAQARLGDLIFNDEVLDGDAVEGLTWLTLAERGGAGTQDEIWIKDLYERAFSVATPDQRANALVAADLISARMDR